MNIQIYNHPYGAEEIQDLDLVLPAELKGDAGLVFFIHGGGYIFGSKEEYKEGIVRYADRHRVACAAMNYRYASEKIGIDEIIQDITAALTEVKALAAQRGVNLCKMVLNGGSAGAHLSLLYAYKYRALSPIPPVGVVSFCGVTDYTDAAFYGKNMMWYKTSGDWKELNELWSNCFKVKVTQDTFPSLKAHLLTYSPVGYVGHDTVPTALFHGNADTMVPYSNAVTLEAKLAEMGVPHKLATGEGVDHNIFTDKAFGKQATDEIDRFIELYLK